MQNTESHDVIALGNQPCSCINTGVFMQLQGYPSDAQTRFQGLWSKDRPVGVLPGLRGGRKHHRY